MSFKIARLTATYMPDNAEQIILCRAGQDHLLEWEEEETSVEVARQSFVSSSAVWDRAVPRGGGLKTIQLTVLWEYLTVAQMEAEMRLREVTLLRHRHGYLELLEGYHQGVPAVGTRWECTIGNISLRKQTDNVLNRSYGAGTLRGKANGEMTVELNLCRPELMFGIRSF